MYKQRKAGCTNYADVTSDYMLFPSATAQPPTTGGKKQRGGNGANMSHINSQKLGGNGIDIGNFGATALSYLSTLQATPATSPATSQATPATPVSKAGCGSCAKKGGAVELAPFVAALAFLATRFATDKNFDINTMMKSKSSSKLSKSKKSSSRKSE